MKLKGKVALVTGAGRGIGKAIAMRFAYEGARVAINYIPDDRYAKDAAQSLAASLGPAAIAIAADVSKPGSVEWLFAEIMARFGRLDIAVNNAGIGNGKPLLQIEDDDWNKVIGTNLYGTFFVSRAAARQMVAQGQGGKLINISSIHENVPFPRFTAYCASKGGIRMMMRNLAIELAPHKINVNNIAPGAILTTINQKVLSDPNREQRTRRAIPWGRFGGADEVASLALFLASADSDYVTGATYTLDGGLTQQLKRTRIRQE